MDDRRDSKSEQGNLRLEDVDKLMWDTMKKMNPTERFALKLRLKTNRKAAKKQLEDFLRKEMQ